VTGFRSNFQAAWHGEISKARQQLFGSLRLRWVLMRRREFLSSVARGAGAAALLPATGALSAFAFGADDASGTAICLNQAGYLPLREKMATVGSQAASFVVRSAGDNSVAFKGDLGAARSDEASGDTVRIADFSKLTKAGSYRLELNTGERSAVFPVGARVYHDPLRLSMRAFYGQRCGCNVDLGGGYRHPACHAKGAFHASSGKSGGVANHGGWHDAGDYGRYVVNSGISTGTLLWAWEMYGARLKGLSLAIPEPGGKTPDFLAEVRWNLNWMLSMQDDDGGVWHKQTSEQFCGFIMPQADTLTSYVIGTGSAPYKSTCATADLAAVMAIAARCYGPYDAAFAQRCLAAARKAFIWAVANPAVYFHNPPGVATGAYDDNDGSDEILWAAAELWRTTGEDDFGLTFAAVVTNRLPQLNVTAPTWSNVGSMAYWAYALAHGNGDAKICAAVREATLSAAESLVQAGSANGYGNTLSGSDYIWGSNGVAGNHSLLLLIANHFQANSAYVNSALANLHYLLGRNCFGVSWVTHVGTRPFQHPHHRPSVADGIPAPWPGLLSGGPNATPADAVAEKLPQRAPMRMWVDDSMAYSVNEVAINWNAPLVFLLAAADCAA
jgi:endoglucanase